MPILVLKASASSIECVVKTTALSPRPYESFAMMLHMKRFAFG